MDDVKSTLVADLEESLDEPIEEAMPPMTKEAEFMIRAFGKYLAMMRGDKNAKPLTFREYKVLPSLVQKNYKQKFGKPKTEEAERAARRKIEKRRAKAKRARRARRAQRVT